MAEKDYEGKCVKGLTVTLRGGHNGHMTTTKLSITKVLDREGEGCCQECGRTNVRWIAVLSDGSTVGSECAKKITGQAFSPAKYAPLAGATEIASGLDCGATWTLFSNGARGILALNGLPQVVGSLASVTAEFNNRTN